MIDKIGYQNKQAFQNDEDIPENQKVTDLDMNEIKKVVNNNAEELNSTNEKVALGFKSAFTYKGSVNTYTDLSSIEAINGDIYTVNNISKNYAWNGESWIEYNSNIDISTIEQQVNNVTQDVTKNKNDITEINQDIVSINKNIDSINQDIEEQSTDISNLKDKAWIRVGLQNSITVLATNDRKEFRMPFDVVRYQEGNLTYDAENDEIVVGANINVILVNVQLYFYDGVELSSSKVIYIRKNQNYPEKDSNGSMNARIGLAVNQTTCEVSTVIPVQEGDRISIGVIANKDDPINNNSSNTFVEAVKVS